MNGGICDRCQAEIKLTENMPMTPCIIYFSGNHGASCEKVYLCHTCYNAFCEWFKSYALEED